MSSGYTPGQILTAAALNASFDAKVDADAAAITGGTIEGLTLLEVTGTTDSTSPTTGAVTVAGGVGVALDVQVGGKITATGEVIVNSTEASTSPTTGALVVVGGVGVSGALNVGGSVDVSGSLTVSEPIEAASTEDSTNTTTGAVIVVGGVGIAKSLNVGTNATVGGTLNVTGAVEFSSTTDSTGSGNGAIVVAGGVGIAKNLNVGEGVTAQTVDVNASTASTNPTTGALIVAGGVGVGGNVNIAENLVVDGTSTLEGAVDITNTTASTNASTGALVVAGGVGIGGAVNVTGAMTAAGIIKGDSFVGTSATDTSTIPGPISATNATASTSPTTGALVVSGGVGVGGAVNVSGNIAVGGTAAITGNTTISGLIGAKGHSNLLYNSTGEFGNLGWTGSTFAGQNDATGAGGSLFTNTAALAAAASDVSQNIPVGPAIVISLTGDILTSGLTAGVAALTLTAFSSVGANLGTVCSITLANGTAFSRVTASGTTPANTAYVQLTKGVTGGTVTATALGVGFKRIKVENSAFSTLYSQEASFASTSGLSSTNPTIAAGPLTFADGTQQFSAAPGKNRIINGNCVVTQRAGLSNSSTNAYGQVDRFQALNSSSGGTIGSSQQSLVFNGVTRKSVMNVVGSTVPTTLTGASYFGGIYQAIEGFGCYDMLGQAAAISFIFIATVVGVYSVSIADYTGTHSYTTTFNYTSANTPQYVALSIPALPTSMTVPQSSAGGLTVTIGNIATGTRMCPTASLNTWTTSNFLSAQGAVNWATASGNDIAVSELQLEVGPDATPFERRPITDEFDYCYRYYWASSLAMFGWPGNPSDTFRNWSGSFPVAMRIAPTLSVTSSAGLTSLAANNTLTWSANLNSGNTTTSYSINTLTASAEL